MTQTKKMDSITIPDVRVETFTITLIGDTPLIVQQFSQKKKNEMLAKQMKKAKSGREPKDPQADFEGSMYRFEDGGHGFPARGFKASAINACRQIPDIAMTQAKGAFQVMGEDGGELVRLKCSEPIMREDVVRIGMGVSDLRYRPEYQQWEVDLIIKYSAGYLSKEQIVNLINTAGFCSGIGEWRPSSPKCTGSFGMYHVKRGGEK